MLGGCTKASSLACQRRSREYVRFCTQTVAGWSLYRDRCERSFSTLIWGGKAEHRQPPLFTEYHIILLKFSRTQHQSRPCNNIFNSIGYSLSHSLPKNNIKASPTHFHKTVSFFLQHIFPFQSHYVNTSCWLDDVAY